jgi:methylglutaconyl-CoA hydratase
MSLVIYSVKDRVGYLTLNRPEKRNALSHELVHELTAAFDRAENDSSLKVVVLKANGDAFCAGADLAYLQQLQHFSFEQNLEDSRQLKNLFLKIYRLKKVVIAQVQGHALAGGCGLATVCDFTFSVPEAKFGYTEVKIGFIPALVSVFLIRKIGEHKAKQLLLTGEVIKASEALTRGLINQVVNADVLEQTVFDFASHLILSNSGQSMQMTKQLIDQVQSLSLEQGLEQAANMNAQARSTEDCKAGIAAFLSKQELKW